MTILKGFAADNLDVARMTISLFDRAENIVGKGENAGYQQFLLFLQCFPKPSSLGVVTSLNCVEKKENTVHQHSHFYHTIFISRSPKRKLK